MYMTNFDVLDRPLHHPEIESKSSEIGFTMPSDIYIGTLLKTLVASKPGARFLELGTGIGFSLSWMVSGMDRESVLITVDNDPGLCEIAEGFFGTDTRVQIVCEDGAQWIKKYTGKKFDLVFADAWPGKYDQLDELLDLINMGGFYIIDDLMEQPNWPESHQDKVNELVSYLENRKDMVITKLDWSTGLIIAVKKENYY